MSSASALEGGSDVRFGSKADIEARPFDVRFTPESGRQLSAFMPTARGLLKNAIARRKEAEVISRLRSGSSCISLQSDQVEDK